MNSETTRPVRDWFEGDGCWFDDPDETLSRYCIEPMQGGGYAIIELARDVTIFRTMTLDMAKAIARAHANNAGM